MNTTNTMSADSRYGSTAHLKRTLAECSVEGEMTLAQLAKEADMTPVSVANILEHNSRHFYSRRDENGVIHWSMAY